MSYDDHPIDDGTVVIPTPGGRQRERAAPPQDPPPAMDGPALSTVGVNPLVAAAAPILTLAVRLRVSGEAVNVDDLRERVIAAIRQFERQAAQAGVTPPVLRAAHYLLCATVDDIVLNTPWGSQSSWVVRNIVSTFHTDVVGGERVFDLLERLQKDPGTYRDALELLYLCLSLGFEGRLRVVDSGKVELKRIRDSLFATIRQVRGAAERDASPHWRGLQARHRPLAAAMPVWVQGGIAAAALCVLFTGLNWLLNDRSDIATAALAGTPPVAAMLLELPAPAPRETVVVNPTPPVKVEASGDRVTRFLEREIDAKLVKVIVAADSLTVLLYGRGMFASGSAAVEPQFVPVIERIAAALNSEPGSVLVTGHTDNTPIQGSRKLKFPSNFDLSKARAGAVQAILAGVLKEPKRVAAEGRADTAPIEDNATPEGRAANRRIEIILFTRNRPPA